MSEKNQSGVDTMILGASHSIMLSNLPQKIQMGDLSPLSSGFFSRKKSVDFQQFGLFDNNPNYNTFYPEVEGEDLKPKDDEFIEPVFRLLSNCIVNKAYSPVEFPADVLKASMPLLVGQTVNCDHETAVGNAIGTVKSVFWQDSYVDKATGVEVPAGINGVLKIDGKSNPRIARGIQMDPPSVHSNSVTVMFEWEPSHLFDKPYEFYEKWGTYDSEGNLVRKIVTKIISYKETSLVSHGADPFAQIIKDGKIVNPAYAGNNYNSFSEGIKVPDRARDYVSYFDFKSFKDMDLYGVNKELGDYGSKYNTIININKSNKKLSEMDEGLNQFLEEIRKSMTGVFKEEEAITKEMVVEKFKEANALVESYSAELKQLKEETSKLNEQLREYKEMAEVGETHLAEVRELTLANYRKLNGETVDDTIIALIEGKDTGIKTLIALNKGYQVQLEEKFPLVCKNCGSKGVDRGSAAKEGDEEVLSEGHKNIRDVATALANRKLRGEQ